MSVQEDFNQAVSKFIVRERRLEDAFNAEERGC